MENRTQQRLNLSSAREEDHEAEKKKKIEENKLQVTQNPPANLFKLLNHDKNHNPFSTALVYTVHGF